ncbi:MAG TPA: phosphatidylglycerophosphatase A [Candidatus Aminicenantes bacterium]|nr:phosphatidylglycerophosphatase A [Candidatus Aminicenantes bacterium]
MKTIWKIIATFFFAGFFPFAPGTFASLIIVVLYKFLLIRLAWPVYLGLAVLLSAAGIQACSRYAEECRQKDPSRIVVDEAAGQMLTLIAFPGDWTALLCAFLLFRFFDVLKPFPIRRLEKLPRGWGIMADDLGAALFAVILARLYLLLR